MDTENLSYFTECKGCYTSYSKHSDSGRTKPDGKCSNCEGKGKKIQNYEDYTFETCNRCKGTGVCPGCGGSGVIVAKFNL